MPCLREVTELGTATGVHDPAVIARSHREGNRKLPPIPSRFSTRRLKPHDEPRWRELFAGYVAFYGADVADDVIALTFARLLEAQDQVGLVAVDPADRPIGIAHLLFHRSTWSATGYCYLEDLFVDPAIRINGAGRALIEAAAREAEARAATRLYWVTQADNDTARRLYDKVATLAPFVQYRR